MEGIVLNTDLKSDSGILRAAGGKRYSFNITSCLNGKPIDGNIVDFEEKDGEAKEIYITKMSARGWADWMFWFLFSFRGRISRDQFFMFLSGAFVFIPVFVLLLALISKLTGTVNASDLFLDAGLLLVLYVKCCVVVKRFHDTGTSGWWLASLMVVTSVIGLTYVGFLILPVFGGYTVRFLLAMFSLLSLFCLYLCFAKGNMAENRYGTKPYTCKTRRLK